MAHTYKSDVDVLIQFAKDQGFDLDAVFQAVNRLEYAIGKGFTDYSIPDGGEVNE